MGMVRNVALAVLAKKAYDYASKPENQARIKQMITQATAKANSTATARQRRPSGY
jgi:DNA-binding NtrC family response regulator